jgi:molybdopterin-synthase adenylyltransferase
MQDKELLRYSRQIMLPAIDISGQQKLSDSTALIIGAGGLGTPAALYLVSAGIGHIIIVDDDQIELSNLQRQILYQEDDIGKNKAEIAAQHLRQHNHHPHITAIVQRLSHQHLHEQCQRADIVLDCSDNFETRFAINAACWSTQTPLISGAALNFDGQLTTFNPNSNNSPCYQCLYPGDSQHQDTRCAENGILGPIVGTIGVLQALEAIKVITGTGTPLIGRLLIFDGMESSFRSLKLEKDLDCQVCNH